MLAANAAEENANESIASEGLDSNKSIDANGDEFKFNNAAEQESIVKDSRTDEYIEDTITSVEPEPIEGIKKDKSAAASFGVYLRIKCQLFASGLLFLGISLA
ncbi:hypothetical protein HYW20_00055 [Candidatus Woesearchaeota archaeon]|nr:hypothetical protein [Candidatus Woesearchaeota archaeon]